MRFLLKNPTTVISLFFILGAFLRFYNLNWGAPYYFHPDERNIASAVSQLKFPEQMNPNFFAYGSLPIYSIFTLGLIKNLALHCLPSIQSCLPTSMTSFSFLNDPIWQKINHLSFEEAIIISRFFSAIFSSLLIILIYFAGKKLHSVRTGLIAAFLTTTSVGFIQFAHFGTFEVWLTFFSVLLFIFCIKILDQYSTRYVLLSGVLMGILISTKISHLVLLPLPIICVTIALNKTARSSDLLKDKIKILLEFIAQVSAIIVISVFIFFITNPYTILDFSAFRNSMNYETGVALGTLDVFYTHEFFDTIPVIFQFLNVYPFLLNPLITALVIPSLLLISWEGLKTKNKFYLLLVTFYLLLFLSQVFLFVKWTRYMIPTLPFIYLIVAISIADIFKKYPKISSIKYQVLSVIGIVSLLFTFSYYVTVLASEDSRVEAAKWAKKNINTNSNILSESYDIGIIAFNSHFLHIAVCDMYYLEKNLNQCNGFSFEETLKEAEYIILPSERVLKMSLTKKDRFPKRYSFYKSLLETDSYRTIYKTPCDTFCQILYLGDTLYPLEQTTHVFDHPTVYILKKI